MKSENSKNMLDIAIKALDEKKAIDLKAIDISEISIIADYFIIVSGSNPSQVHALCDNVSEKMSKAGYNTKKTEGYNNANWILMDYGDIIIHIFDKESRSFYDLERIWADGNDVSPN